MQQAFVKAISKPENDRPSIHDEKKFVAWMCAMAKYEAMTGRIYDRRRTQREMSVGDDIAEMSAIAPSVGSVEARKMLERAFTMLEPEEQALLHALYAEGKTITELANEKGLSWSTMDSRRQQLLKLLYAAIQALITTLALLPRKARAFVAHVTQQLPRLSSVMSVTAACGVLVPSGSSIMNESLTSLGFTQVATKQTNTAIVADFRPSFVPKVAPEEPNGLDAETNSCSPGDMKSAKIASILQETVVPLAFVVAPALGQVACAGSDQQTPAARQPDEEHDDSADPYEVMCDQERARGNTCPSREEWLKKIFHR